MSIKKEMLFLTDQIRKICEDVEFISGTDLNTVLVRNEQLTSIANNLPNPPMTKAEAKEVAFEYAKQFELDCLCIDKLTDNGKDWYYRVMVTSKIGNTKTFFPFED